MEFWQTVIATIVGGVITLVATYLTSRGQRKLESGKKLIEKLEYTHTLTSKVEHMYRAQWGSDLAFLQSGVRHSTHTTKERVPFEELEMLAAFYAPGLSSEVALLISHAQGEYGKLLLRVESRSSLSQDEITDLQTKLVTAFNEIKASIVRLQNGLTKLGRAHL